MERNKKITIILMVVLPLVVIYSVFSKSNSLKDIRKLTIEIESKVDSLKNIQSPYDSLEKAYGKIYEQFYLTKENLNNLHETIDSIMNSNITSASRINNSLKKLIEDQQKLEILNSDSSSFRFK